MSCLLNIAASLNIANLISPARVESIFLIIHLFFSSQVFLCIITFIPSALISFDKNFTVNFKDSSTDEFHLQTNQL